MEPHRGRGRLGLRDVRLDTCFGAFGLGRAYIYVCVFIVTDRPQILCVIPVPILRWVLVGVAFALSGYFLVANVYPILASVSPRYQTKFFGIGPFTLSFRPKQNLPVSSLFSSESSMQVWR